jgi:hypothetical protein
MAEPRKLSSPRATVVRDGFEPVEIQTDNRDLILWDKTRIRHKWGRMDEQPNLWLTFITWAAARRTGVISPDVKYETWELQVIEVEAHSNDDDDELGAPFPGAPAPDS